VLNLDVHDIDIWTTWSGSANVGTAIEACSREMAVEGYQEPDGRNMRIAARTPVVG
jgi:hypothetical protein